MHHDKEQLIIQALASSSLGGGEMVAIDLATSLRSRGHNVAIWCPSEGASAEHARKQNLPTSVMGSEPQYTGHIGSQIRKWLCIKRLCRRENVSLIHCHSPFCYQQLSKAIPRRVKTIAHVHIDNNLHLFPWLFKHRPAAIITCADYLAKATADSLATSQCRIPKIVAAPNSVNTQVFFPDATRKPETKEGHRALVLANLAPHKGHKTAIKAIAELIRRGLQIDLDIAGVDRKQIGYEQELRSLAGELGIEKRVNFMGHQSSPASVLRHADFMLLPSTAEGLPLSILEAQASKTIVLANPVAGVPEVIEHTITGYLIDHKDHTEYANRIQELIQNPQEKQAIAKKAYENIQKNYTWNSYIKKIETIYRQTILN